MALFDPYHSLTCPCGATLATDSEVVAKAWIEAHKEHRPLAPPPKH